MRFKRGFLFTISLIMAPVALAGTWGEENWGQMYWGDNPTSAPIVSPAFDTEVDGDSIIVTINNFIAGSGQDGWSVITGYEVVCSGAEPETSTLSRVIVSGLDEDADYSCTVTAANSFGDSPTALFTTRTETTAGGLPIWLLYEATKPRI
jgi:hypothetical protein